MIDNDDIRYSRAEDRPPWELSPGGHIREWFSCRKVDDTTAGYCHEVEEHKKARVKAQTHRSASHARMQRQREEAQTRLILEQQAAKQRMAEARVRIQADPERESTPPPPPPKDPRAARYSYPEPERKPNTPRRKQSARTVPPVRRGGRNGKVSLPLILFIVILSSVIGYISENGVDEIRLPDFISERVTEEPTERPTDRDENNDDFFGRRFGGDDIPWDDILPDADEDEIQQSNIPKAPAGTVTLDIQSSKGLEPLSFQELYERCVPSTVSVRVYAQDGGGTGTGIILSEDGYLLTCAHVVAGGNRCTITTWDNHTYEALLVGSDPQSDLAVLKVEATDLTPAQFGDSDELTVGDEVLAIGDPLGTELRGTMTNGIVSAINRNVTVKTYPMTLIQTTAPLNAGNSGGPLFNIYGQVVGVNNMKMISSAVTVEGLGFAVPTSVIREILPVLTTEGKVSRPVLGITCYEVDEDTKESMDLPATGLRVSSIKQGSRVEDGGLKLGDYIQAVNGEEVTRVQQVRDILNRVGIDGQVTLTVYRWDDEQERGETLELTVTVVDQADMQ